MKKIRVKAIKGNREITVVGKNFKTIANIFSDWDIFPANVDKVDTDKYFNRLVSNIEKNNKLIFYDGKQNKKVHKKDKISHYINENMAKEGNDLYKNMIEGIGFDELKSVGQKIKKRAKENMLDLFD